MGAGVVVVVMTGGREAGNGAKLTWTSAGAARLDSFGGVGVDDFVSGRKTRGRCSSTASAVAIGRRGLDFVDKTATGEKRR